jgi:hypothetical protein
MTKKPAKKATPKKKAPPVARSTATEQVMRNVQKAIEGKDFSSFDDLNAFLATLSGSTMLESVGRCGVLVQGRSAGSGL